MSSGYGDEYLAKVKAYKEVFKKYDKDGNGVISFEEAEKVYLERGQTAAQALAWIKKHDTTGRGVLTWPDFVVAMDAQAAEMIEISRESALLDSKMENYRQEFSKIDKDKNGRISIDELTSTMLALNKDKDRDYVVDSARELFDRMDKDKNGLIDLSEFVREFEAREQTKIQATAQHRQERRLSKAYRHRAASAADMLEVKSDAGDKVKAYREKVHGYRELFKKFSADGKNITYKDVREYAKAHGHSDVESLHWFQKKDLEDTGVVTWPEFVEALDLQREGKLDKDEEARQIHQLEEYKKRFDQLDEKKAGKITHTALALALEEIGRQQKDDASATAKQFLASKKKKDEEEPTIEFDEFVEEMRKKREADAKDRAENRFRKKGALVSSFKAVEDKQHCVSAEQLRKIFLDNKLGQGEAERLIGHAQSESVNYHDFVESFAYLKID